MPGIRRHEFGQITDRLKVKPELFIETGTWKGATTLEALSVFSRVKTIELDRELYLKNLVRFKDQGSWLEQHCGNSAELLPKISEPIPTFYYLDAHWWSELDGTTFNVPLPLWDELRYISSRHLREILVVDDIQAFGGVDERTVIADWVQVTIPNILAAVPNCIYHYQNHNRLIMRLEER